MSISFAGSTLANTYTNRLQHANMAALNLAGQATPQQAGDPAFALKSKNVAMDQAFFGAMSLAAGYMAENDKANAKKWASSFNVMA